MKVQAKENLYIPKDIVRICEQIAPQYGFEPELVEAIIWVESRCDSSAQNQNCIGLMQVNMDYWKKLSTSLGFENVNEPLHNVVLGCEILTIYMEDSDLHTALVKYNGSEFYARTVEAIYSYMKMCNDAGITRKEIA